MWDCYFVMRIWSSNVTLEAYDTSKVRKLYQEIKKHRENSYIYVHVENCWIQICLFVFLPYKSIIIKDSSEKYICFYTRRGLSKTYSGTTVSSDLTLFLTLKDSWIMHKTACIICISNQPACKRSYIFLHPFNHSSMDLALINSETEAVCH